MALFLITAPSGAGKTTLAHALQKTRHWKECISHTTRKMRDGEENGHTYHFVNNETFDTMKDGNNFAETVIYDSNQYGITKDEIHQKTRSGNHAFIIVDNNGYAQIKAIYPEAVGIFLYMSKEDCLANMLLRGDSVASAMKRIETYDIEMRHAKYYDYIIKNIRGKQASTANILKHLILQYEISSTEDILR